MSEIDIEWTKLSELKTEPKNPKKHDIEKIMLSIERFGFINPFIKKKVVIGESVIIKTQKQDNHIKNK